jgi:hypothetical protein
VCRLGGHTAATLGTATTGFRAFLPYRDRQNPLFWCLHAQDVTPRGRFYPHQWPQGAAQGIIAFFGMLVG